MREGIKRWTSYQRVFKHGTGGRVKSILVDLPSPGQWTSYKGALTQCREMKLGADRKKEKEKKKRRKKKKEDDLIGIKRGEGEETTIKSTKGWISVKR